MMTRHRDVVTSQTRTRERVRELAEVYTHAREVNAMLDLVPDMFPSADRPKDIGRKFLEPACGSGNFLVAILERKLAFVTSALYRSDATFETAVLKAVSSTYGIDIDPTNVDHSRKFMRAEVGHHLDHHGRSVTVDFWSAIDTILGTNIVCADTLADAKRIELVDYHWQRKAGLVIREWSFLEEDEHVDLFSTEATPKRDEVPLVYGELSKHPEPTEATRVEVRAEGGARK
jgi:hypothetical protein